MFVGRYRGAYEDGEEDDRCEGERVGVARFEDAVS